ncbi:MAG: DUF2811 domain-containing protein [Trichocoleus desertorum ATA4-8-CV12]|nr:DUF2811 domain-containing protein [Trichocoleus desertorum ATA4-8-CV12]
MRDRGAIPESLYITIQEQLEHHPTWDINSFFIAVL